MEFVGTAKYIVLNINYCNLFSSAIDIQVLIQRRAIKKIYQPHSQKITLQMLTVVTLKTRAIWQVHRYEQRKKASMWKDENFNHVVH